jgi:hypothetical protein
VLISLLAVYGRRSRLSRISSSFSVGWVRVSAARCICSAGFEVSIPQTIIGMEKGGGVSPGSWETCMLGTQLVSLPTHVTKQCGLTGPSGSASATSRLVLESRVMWSVAL